MLATKEFVAFYPDKVDSIAIVGLDGPQIFPGSDILESEHAACLEQRSSGSHGPAPSFARSTLALARSGRSGSARLQMAKRWSIASLAWRSCPSR